MGGKFKKVSVLAHPEKWKWKTEKILRNLRKFYYQNLFKMRKISKAEAEITKIKTKIKKIKTQNLLIKNIQYEFGFLKNYKKYLR